MLAPVLASSVIPSDYPAGKVRMDRHFWRTLHPDYRTGTQAKNPAALMRDDRNGGGTVLAIVELVDA